MKSKLLFFWIVMFSAAIWPVITAAGVKNADVDRVVNRGLEWLAAHQSRLGHWTANNDRYPTPMTALSGIALLCEGSTTMQGKYAPNIRRAVDYLVSHSRHNGLIGDPRATIVIPTATGFPCFSCRKCWAKRKMPSAARN